MWLFSTRRADAGAASEENPRRVFEDDLMESVQSLQSIPLPVRRFNEVQLRNPMLCSLLAPKKS